MRCPVHLRNHPMAHCQIEKRSNGKILPPQWIHHDEPETVGTTPGRPLVRESEGDKRESGGAHTPTIHRDPARSATFPSSRAGQRNRSAGVQFRSPGYYISTTLGLCVFLETFVSSLDIILAGHRSPCGSLRSFLCNMPLPTRQLKRRPKALFDLCRP